MFKFFKNRKNMALLDAADEGNLKKVRKLLDKGADVNAKKEDGDTALTCASDRGHIEVVKALLEAGAEINTKGKDGYTALIQASMRGHTEVVKVLIKARAMVNAKKEDGDTSLIWASSRGHTEIVEVLLDAGAYDPNSRAMRAHPDYYNISDWSDKMCSQCGRQVSSYAKAGDVCPHCGVCWDLDLTGWHK